MNDLERTRRAEIVRLHGEIGGALRTTLAKAVRIGELLTVQKASMTHGAFLPWIKASVPFDARTVTRYMRCWRERDRLKSDSVSDLTEAYGLLEEPSVRNPMAAQANSERALMEIAEMFVPNPEDYATREIRTFHHEEDGTHTLCLARGPDLEHPYLETADFEVDEATVLRTKDMRQADIFDTLLAAYDQNEITCTGAGTWGNYFNPKNDLACMKHFIHRCRNGKGGFWFGSGMGHRLPEDAFKTDLTIIRVDGRTAEQKAENTHRYLRGEIERHETKIKALRRKMERECPEADDLTAVIAEMERLATGGEG